MTAPAEPLTAALADRYRLEREFGGAGQPLAPLPRGQASAQPPPPFAEVSRVGLFADVYRRTLLAPAYSRSANGLRFLMVKSAALSPLKSLDLVLLDHWVQRIPREEAR